MYYQSEKDETLVLLTLAGEQSAYEALVVRYQKAVIASAASVTQNSFMAEDAAQDAFVTAWMKLNTLQETKKFGAWVCRIAKNCALNMITRYRTYIPLDTMENIGIADEQWQHPVERYVLSEQKKEVDEGVGKLPEKVRQIIHMHYFEGLSIADIADKMRISEGTVKSQLHDGRKKLRKELCAMNEEYNDTLVKRVMKKVEELKLWQIKNDKSGFEVVYKDVLRDVEELPESVDKNHALADVLMRGWWWLPGEKNDALFARIADAAIEGKNEEVMAFIVAREASKVYGGAKIEFIRDKQIPKLEKAGFVNALGREWFWLGRECFRNGKTDEGYAAYDKAESILNKGDIYHDILPYARKVHERASTAFKDKSKTKYMIIAFTDEYKYIDGSLRFWKTGDVYEGDLRSPNYEQSRIYVNSAKCDGQFFADIAVGESIVGSDGTTLTFASDNERVDTPAGSFNGCQLWITNHYEKYDGRFVYKSYYKDGVGIVRHECISAGICYSCVLNSYSIKSGQGLLPLGEGNTWEYVSEYNPDAIAWELNFTVSFADDKKVTISSFLSIERLKYDENSWNDAIDEIHNEYFDGKNVCNVYPAIARAEALAITPVEKAHTKAAASVARRILSTDPVFNPEYTATGHWNFFTKNVVYRNKNGELYLGCEFRRHFELKNMGIFGWSETPLLYNDVLDILSDATEVIWSDKWKVGASLVVEHSQWNSKYIKTHITCEDGGTVTTRAGSFKNCLKLCLDIDGMTDGCTYRGGKKAYYFAEGIGIVRTENLYCGGAKTAVYELTAYEGTGEGYMPIEDGMMRRYEAIGLTDGFVGAAEYTYVADEYGDIIIFTDRTGIREVPPPITQYSAIQNEMLEEHLIDEGKWQEAQMLHGGNNFHIMLHYIARRSWNRNNADRSVAIWRFNESLLKLFGGGEIPSAWLGMHAWSSLVLAAALFGKGEKEEGYKSIEESIEALEKWSKFKKGDELPVGNEYVFGGIRYIKGKDCFVYPDGKREPTEYDFRMELDNDSICYAMTAPHGWEWFDSVRNEERFKQYIERAKKLADKM